VARSLRSLAAHRLSKGSGVSDDNHLGRRSAAATDGVTVPALDTGVRGGPEPDKITLETFKREIPEA